MTGQATQDEIVKVSKALLSATENLGSLFDKALSHSAPVPGLGG